MPQILCLSLARVINLGDSPTEESAVKEDSLSSGNELCSTRVQLSKTQLRCPVPHSASCPGSLENLQVMGTPWIMDSAPLASQIQGVHKFPVAVTFCHFSSATCEAGSSTSACPAVTFPFCDLSQGALLGFTYQFLFY